MANVSVYNMEGKEVGKMDLNDAPDDYYTQTFFSFNTPDFTKTKVDFNSRAAVGAILADERVHTNVR